MASGNEAELDGVFTGNAGSTAGNSNFTAAYSYNKDAQVNGDGLWRLDTLVVDNNGTIENVTFSEVVGFAGSLRPVYQFTPRIAPSPVLIVPNEKNFSQFFICVYPDVRFHGAEGRERPHANDAAAVVRHHDHVHAR